MAGHETKALESLFRKTLEEKCGVRRGSLLLAAVSGGSDSTAMLHLLHRAAEPLRLRLAVAHYNHRLRGRASDADEAFVREQARRLGIPFRAGRRRAAKGHAVHEEAMREARLAFLARAARRMHASAVVLGHNRNDAAETLLLRLLRGAGPEGLAAMPPISSWDGVRFLRPLLPLGRQACRAWLRRNALRWREDRSNRSHVFARNRLRRRVMPILEREFNPKTVETLARAAEILREENLCLEALAEKLSGIGNFLPVVRLRRAPLALRRRAVRAALLRARGSLRRLNFEHVERVLGLLEGGKEVHLPDWWTARRRGGRIVFARERRRATSRERR